MLTLNLTKTMSYVSQEGGVTVALSDRKSKILAAVVEQYLSCGEPVGSKAIMSDELSVSSATIRNELSSLDDLGYLTQPHTSAGRIPTKKGYRYYLDNLMPETELSSKKKEAIARRVRYGVR